MRTETIGWPLSMQEASSFARYPLGEVLTDRKGEKPEQHGEGRAFRQLSSQAQLQLSHELTDERRGESAREAWEEVPFEPMRVLARGRRG